MTAGLLAGGAAGKVSAYVNFESGHVRPLAFVHATGGDLLLAVNTPDDRLAVYTVSATGLTLSADVPVGLDPVAVVARTRVDGSVQAFVINHVSDSVSVLTIDPANASAARVVRTLLVGDEPRDVIVAGPAHDRVFVTAAHRGQNRPGDPQLLVPGVDRADVWVFDAESLGAPLGGTPLAILTLPGDTPRALATTADGRTVYAAVFQSGNGTTVIPENTVLLHGGAPPVPTSGLTPCVATTTTTTLPMSSDKPPATGLIVRLNPATGTWTDEQWHDWSADVPFALPDQDVFLVDAAATPPARAGGANAIAGVGTLLFNMAVRPGTGALYVTNTEARNHVRFEPCLRGHVAESRVTIVHGTMVTSVHLNPHIDYGLIPGAPGEVSQTLALPTDLAFSNDGATVYVAALGSGLVGVLDADQLEAGVVLPRGLVFVGLGASGLALDESHDRLFVMNRIANHIAIIANVSTPATRTLAGIFPLPYSPEPPFITRGRTFLYDARNTSAHGDDACASCHAFGDFDGLSWDLGDPGGVVRGNPNTSTLFGGPVGGVFHPLKGPMATQSLRGMAGAGPLHWRGDKTGAAVGASDSDVRAAFLQFNGAFPGLLGHAQLDASDMESFADFALTIRYPPNPIAALDDVLTADEQAGKTTFETAPIDAGALTCVSCHALPLGTNGLSLSAGIVEPQTFKVANLRNIYEKVGRFGMPTGADLGIPAYTVGAQVRGTGVLHDGSISTVLDFLHAGIFAFTSDQQRLEVAKFLLAFDTGLAPAVGQQVTAAPATFSDATVVARINLLLARSDAGRCDLIVKGRLAAEQRGWVHVKNTGTFTSDRAADPAVAEATLRAQAATAGQERTYTCVPPGEGNRMGVDRDGDGVRDADDTVLDAPTTTTSTTSTTTTTTTTTTGGPHATITIPHYTEDTLFHVPIPIPDPAPYIPGQAPRIH